MGRETTIPRSSIISSPPARPLCGVDIDFSSRSTTIRPSPALAAALARHPGRVVTPAFLQLESDAGGHPLLRETFPNPLFRTPQIGSVSVHPATDSLVRQSPYAEMFGITPYMLVVRACSTIPTPTQPSSTWISASQLVPRRAYRMSDVLNGTFDPKLVLGKNVLIGATAVRAGRPIRRPRLQGAARPAPASPRI